MSDEYNAPAQAAAPETVTAPEPDRFEATVRAWVAGHLANSPLSRVTDAWNHLQASLPALIAKLKEV